MRDQHGRRAEDNRNHLVIEVEFPPDKWRGLDVWQRKAPLLGLLAHELFDLERGSLRVLLDQTEDRHEH